MRLISTQPEFSWTGTLLIVAFSAWLGLFVGLVHGTRMAGKGRWLIPLGVPGILIFLSPGMLFAPAFLLGSAIWNRAKRPVVRRVGIAFGLVAVAGPTLWLWNDTRFDESRFVPTPALDQATICVGFGLLSLALAYGASFMWRPRPAVEPSESGLADVLRIDEGLAALVKADIEGGRQ